MTSRQEKGRKGKQSEKILKKPIPPTNNPSKHKTDGETARERSHKTQENDLTKHKRTISQNTRKESIPMIRINTNNHTNNHRQRHRQRRRRRNKIHDDLLVLDCLGDRCAAEDRAGHHPWDGD